MVMGHLVRRFMERARRGRVKNQGSPVVAWKVERRVWVVVSVVSRSGVSEEEKVRFPSTENVACRPGSNGFCPSFFLDSKEEDCMSVGIWWNIWRLDVDVVM